MLQDLFENYVPADLVVAGASQEDVNSLLDPGRRATWPNASSPSRKAWEAVKHTGYGEAVRILGGRHYTAWPRSQCRRPAGGTGRERQIKVPRPAPCLVAGPCGPGSRADRQLRMGMRTGCLRTRVLSLRSFVGGILQRRGARGETRGGNGDHRGQSGQPARCHGRTLREVRTPCHRSQSSARLFQDAALGGAERR